MDKIIVHRNFKEYQLISISIDLVNKILSAKDCDKDVSENVHLNKAYELANKWNEVFFSLYVSKEGA